MKRKIGENNVNIKKPVVWKDIAVNLFIGIFICPIISYSYLIIGFGGMNEICFFIEAIFLGFICGGIAYYYAKKVPKLFLLWPMPLSLPFSGTSFLWALGDYLRSRDLTVTVLLVVPFGMLSFGLLGSWIGYYFHKLEKEYRS